MPDGEQDVSQPADSPVPSNPSDLTRPVDLTTRKANLDATASCCQTTARYDRPMFVTSGFQPASKNTSQSELDTPSVTGVDNDMATELAVHLSPIANAVGYEVQTSPDGTNGTTVKFSPQARLIALTGLTAGTPPQVRARALGGSPGESQWSLPVSCKVH